jgi:MFS family permease
VGYPVAYAERVPGSDRVPFLINRQYARLWSAQTISMLGDFMFDTTLVLWVGAVLAKGQSWAPVAVSGVLLAVAVPALLVAPIAGVFVDRWDYRRTMLATDAIRAVLVAVLVAVPLLPAGTLSVGVQLGIVYGVVLLASVAAQFFNPARFALIGDIVDPADRPKASSLAQVTQSLAGIIGPPLAAPLLFVFGVQWSLIINALSFVVSYLLVWSIRVPAVAEAPAREPGAASVWREFVAGLRFVGRSRVLMAVLISAAGVTFGAGALTVLDVFFVSENLHTDPKFFGTLAMAFGIGNIIGALLAGAVAGRVGLGRVYSLGLVLTGVGFFAYSRLGNLVAALVVLFLVGLPVAAVNTIVGPMILKVTPRELIGRVISVLNPALQLAGILSIAIASYLASTLLRGLDATVAGVHFGRIDTIFAAGGVMIIVSAVYAYAALRGTDAPPEPAPEPAEAAQPVAPAA